ncbi:FkbM family methyltransferase [Pelagibacteraceae bacterium]|nr:FkbM family methyltransferase [Pelagibacteraceae bacterium]
MFKKISYTIYKILYFIDSLLYRIFKRRFLIWFNEFIQNDSYVNVKVLGRKILFFCPNQITQWRVETLFTKEPETLKWIDSFQINNKIIFWDIGANIGLYSIYASLKHSNIEVVCFEPSTSNLRILSRNISINSLEKKIKINQLPLTNQNNKFLLMHESSFEEGSALNTFGENLSFDGKIINKKNNYQILGTSINNLLDNKILSIPNFIKLDVDGIEHLILHGADKYLKNENLKSLSIELNENFKDQYNEVLTLMKNNDFTLKSKDRAESFYKSRDFSKTYNYIFEK